MKEKIYKNLLRIFGFTIILTLGVLIGSYITEDKIEKEQGSLYNITKIAVVNLDEGIDYEGTYRNFASELISSQDKEIVVTGLDDAKSGVDEGRYAAYIIMPSDFSKNTTTINTEPIKSLIKYEIGSNLSSVARDRATVNVADINKSINDDLGYVYLNSVFNSFHEGQNSALKVIDNDSKDKEVIMSISNVDLIESIDLTEVEQLQNDIEKLDVVEDFEKNQQLISAIDLAYKSYLGETSDEISNIKTDSNNLIDLNKNLGATINSIPTIESEGYNLSNTNSVLSTFKSEVDTFKSETTNILNTENTSGKGIMDGYKGKVSTFIASVDAFNTKFSSYNTFSEIKTSLDDVTTSLDIADFPSISNRIDLIIKENEKSNVSKQIEDYIQTELLEQIGIASDADDALQNIFDKANLDNEFNKLIVKYSELNNLPSITNLKQYYDYTHGPDDSMQFPLFDSITLKEDFITDIKTEIPLAYKSVYDKIDEYDADFPDIAVDTKTITDQTDGQTSEVIDLTTALNKINGLSYIADDDIKNSVSNDLEPLKTKQRDGKKSLIEKSNNNLLVSDVFSNRLNSFDPLQFIDDKEVEGFMNNYKRNTSSVESKFNSKDFEYKSFVDKSYNQANQHVDTIRQDIGKYQSLSDEKLTSGLQNAQDTKSQTSNDNRNVMSNFINTLPYSRLGESANTQLYQFMTDPVVSEGRDSTTITIQKSNDYNIYIFSILIGTAALLLGTVIFNAFYKRKERA